MPGFPGRFSDDTAHAAGAFTASLAAAGVASIGFLFCFGFEGNSAALWSTIVGLAWFLLNFSFAARTLVRLYFSRWAGSWWLSHAALTLFALAAAAGCGVESTAAAHGAKSILTGLGIAAFCVTLSAVSLFRFRDLLIQLIAAVFFALLAAGASWGNGFQNPLCVEAISFGEGQIDTLYHVTVSNMIRTYGIASTGLDGLPYMPYHNGSHWLFARLSNLLDVRVIDFYNRAYPVLFVPFGLFSVVTLSTTLGRERFFGSRGESRPSHPPNMVEDQARDEGADDRFRQSPALSPMFWLLVFAGYVGFLPYSSMSQTIASRNCQVVSESYGVAVSVSLLTIAAALPLFSLLKNRNTGGHRTFFVGVTFLALLFAAIGCLKISVMLVLFATFCYFVARLALYRSVAGMLVIGAIAVSSFLTYRYATSPGYAEQMGFSPFGFLRANFEVSWWPYYWLFYYAWFWIASGFRFREERIATVDDLIHAFRSRRIIDLELLGVVALAGSAPGLLITSYSSSQYFSDYQRWLGIAIVLGVLLREKSQLRPLSTDPARRLRLRTLFTAAVLTSVGCEMSLNTAILLRAAVKTDLSSRGHAAGLGLGVALMQGEPKKVLGLLRESAETTQKRMQSQKSVLVTLKSLDELPLAQKRQSLLFIPQSNSQFWKLLHGPYAPGDGPFVATALSGIAMIEGVPPMKPKDFSIGYGYAFYRKSSASVAQPPLDASLPDLRRRCAQMGFSQLIVIDNDKQGMSCVRTFACN